MGMISIGTGLLSPVPDCIHIINSNSCWYNIHMDQRNTHKDL